MAELEHACFSCGDNQMSLPDLHPEAVRPLPTTTAATSDADDLDCGEYVSLVFLFFVYLKLLLYNFFPVSFPFSTVHVQIKSFLFLIFSQHTRVLISIHSSCLSAGCVSVRHSLLTLCMSYLCWHPLQDGLV